GFLAASGLLAGAEAAYFSLSRHGAARLEAGEGGDRSALARLLEKPHELLITILVGITLVNIASAALATTVADALLARRGVALAPRAMIFVIVVFGEVLPMTIAVDAPQRFGRLAARPVLVLAYLLTPVRAVLGAFTALVSRAVSREETPQTAITEAELRTLVEVGHREGAVERGEREMIHGGFDLGGRTVWDIMPPRTAIFGLDASTPP